MGAKRRFLILIAIIIFSECPAQMFHAFQRLDSNYLRLTKAPNNLFAGFEFPLVGDNSIDGIYNQNIVAWWTSEYGVTLNSTTVSAWQDMTNTYTISNVTASQQPTYTAADASFQNYPSIAFDGSNDYLSGGDVLDIGTTSWTLQVVVYIPAAQTNKNIVGKSGQLSAISTAGQYGIGTTSTNHTIGFYDSGAHSPTLGVPTTSHTYIITMVLDRTNGTLYYYRTSDAAITRVTGSTSIDVSSSNLNTTNNFVVGGSTAGSNNYQCTVLTVLVYNTALTATQVAQNEYSLKAKYGF